MGVYIIAEAGVNHNGDINIAKEMIRQAKNCGCNCIKFQTYKTEALVTRTAKKANYQVTNTHNDDSQYQMLKQLELSFDDFRELKDLCEQIGIDFMSTPFDCASVDLLEELGMNTYKMSSGDITNKQLLQYVAKQQKPMIVSTGMCTMEEVREAIDWIEACGNHKITLLHCTSNYPAPYEEVNMNAMLTLRKEFPYRVGYSDHTKGIVIPVMACAMGAQVLEKHFTLDKTMEGPDHKASLDIDELRDMVEAVRNIEKAFGDGQKKPTKSEMNTREVARKSVVLNHDKKKDQIILIEDLTLKRPGNGIAPKYMEDLVGKRLKRNIAADTSLCWEDMY